jgi:hypothetical protein
MRKTLLLMFAVCFLFSASSFAQRPDFQGEFVAGGHLGYALGMGDAFQDYTEPFTNTEFSSGAGLSFGGQFFYGWQEKFLIGGELMIQNYGYKVYTPANLTLGIPEMEVSDNELEINILANGLYAVNQSRESAFFLLGGTGLYDFGGMKMGLNGGLIYRRAISDNVYFFGMPRMHIVFTDNTPMMIQLNLGVQFPLGG